jgi:hypothetical protein
VQRGAFGEPFQLSDDGGNSDQQESADDRNGAGNNQSIAKAEFVDRYAVEDRKKPSDRSHNPKYE